MRKSYLDDEIPDGRGVRVPITLMDSVQRQFAFDAENHRPHYARLTDEQQRERNSSYEAYKQNLSRAWRNKGRYPASGDDVALAEKVASILGLAPPVTATSAPPYNDPRSFAGNYNKKLMRGRDDRAALDADSAKAVRDAAYTAYCNRLTSAWRGGR